MATTNYRRDCHATRDEFRNLFTQDYQLFAPNAEVGPGTQPYVDGSLAADATLVIVNDAVTIGNGTNIDTSTGTWLTTDRRMKAFKLPAAGASGYVVITTAVGGPDHSQGDEVTEQVSGFALPRASDGAVRKRRASSRSLGSTRATRQT